MLDGVDLDVAEGTIFALLGPNGAGMQAFAEHQPFTPIIETLRGLLMGTEIGDSALLAVAWCAALALIGYLWARAAFDREPSR